MTLKKLTLGLALSILTTGVFAQDGNIRVRDNDYVFSITVSENDKDKIEALKATTHSALLKIDSETTFLFRSSQDGSEKAKAELKEIAGTTALEIMRGSEYLNSKKNK